MSTIVKLVQGSPEWHAHRRHHRNASETPAVLGVSPWTTPYQLWLVKTGRAPQPEVTAAMAHGTQLEPQAREAYEQLTGLIMEPLVLVDGDYSASLDGITLDGELVLEVKCPKSKDSKILASAKAGCVPVDVYWQLQHQLMVSSAELAHLYVYDGSVGILLEQRPEPAAYDTIRQDWDAFMNLVRTDQPPALTERDTVVRTDVEWVTAAREYVELKRLADDTATALAVHRRAGPGAQRIALDERKNETTNLRTSRTTPMIARASCSIRSSWHGRHIAHILAEAVRREHSLRGEANSLNRMLNAFARPAAER